MQPSKDFPKSFKEIIQDGNLKEAATIFLTFYETIFKCYRTITKVKTCDPYWNQRAREILLKEHAVRFPMIRAHRLSKKEPIPMLRFNLVFT